MGCCNKPKLLVFELPGEIKPYFADSKYKQKIFRNNQNKQKENFGVNTQHFGYCLLLDLLLF